MSEGVFYFSPQFQLCDVLPDEHRFDTLVLVSSVQYMYMYMYATGLNSI